MEYFTNKNGKGDHKNFHLSSSLNLSPVKPLSFTQKKDAKSDRDWDSLSDSKKYRLLTLLLKKLDRAWDVRDFPDDWRTLDDTNIELFGMKQDDKNRLYLYCKAELQHLKNKLSVSPTPVRAHQHSFLWWGRPEELSKLYRQMLGQFIDPATTEAQFTAAFTRQPLSQVTPIRWLTSAASLLYFILQAKDQGLLEKEEPPKTQGERSHASGNGSKEPKGDRLNTSQLTACFVGPDSRPFGVNWKNIKGGLLGKNPANFLSVRVRQQINDLLADFV